MRRWLPVFVLGLLLAPVLRAQPANVTRVLSTFDFEERRLGNVEDLPMHWSKVEGPGLPHYVNGRLSSDEAHGGRYSFRFELNGGGLVYRYPSGHLRVQRGAHYRVEGFVRTTPLPNARARITAYFADIDAHPLLTTMQHSELYAAGREDEPWQRLSVELTEDHPKAAYLVIELELLQRSQYTPEVADLPKAQRPLFDQDIHGVAWFDDVTVSQVPQLALSTDRPGNIFRRSDALQLHVLMNDRFTDDLSAQLRIRDAEGKLVFQHSGATVDIAMAETTAPAEKRLSLNIPELPAGWYQATLTMSSGVQFVGEESIDFLRLADDRSPVPTDPRFGIDATALPLVGTGELPQIMQFLGAGRVKLAVWNREGDVELADSAAFDRVLEQLQQLQVTPTACLNALPPQIAQRVNGSDWTQLLSADRSLWQPQLSYLIARHANHLVRWQIGPDGTDAFVRNRQMRRVYQMVYDEFAALVDKPDLAMPWPAWYDLDAEAPANIALSVPPDVLPAQLPLYLQDLHGRDGRSLSIALDSLPRERYGREVQIRDFAQRFAYALSAGAERIDVKLPFTVSERGEQLEKHPTELLLIARTLMNVLGRSTFRGKVPISADVEAFLFDRNGQGILMLWNRGKESGVKQLPINVAPSASRMDLWGNLTSLVKGSGRTSADDVTSVPVLVGPLPCFLLDVDGPIAQLRASVHLNNEKLESNFKEHGRRLIFTNPYPQAIAGTLRLRPPQGWTISPPTVSFSLNPGETFDREIRLQFPYNSFAGEKTILAEFQVQAETNTSFTVPITLKLGLSDVGLQTLALRDGKDVIVQQMITNYGERPIDYTAFAILPGQARQERVVSGLGAGRTTIKKYRFPNVTVSRGAHIRSGVKELQGTRILNDEVQVQ